MATSTVSATTRPRVQGGGTALLFNPMGINTVMFNVPLTEPDINHIASEENLPVPLARCRISGAHLSAFYGRSFTLLLDGIDKPMT
ncbi:hypothetical protein P4S70_16005 [Enterovibrio sp. Hal110]